MLGFDYGTSNCAVAIMDNGQPKSIHLGDHGKYMASSLYAPSREIIVNWLHQNLTGDNQAQFQQNRAYLLQKGQDSLQELKLDGIDTHLSFGQAALARYLEDPSEGYYIKSPKSFLGTNGLLPAQIAFFENIVAAMMAHVKSAVEKQLGKEQTQVVIGRPVNFQGRNSKQSNKQAIDVLTNAAKLVGYKDIEFQYEPVAAGFEFEAGLTTETKVLVVDIGGGTSDCSMLLMGPDYKNKIDRSNAVLGHSGIRIGGNDFDIQLALKGVMPQLGINSNLKSGKPMPVNSYFKAVAINDVNAQSDFYSAANGRFLEQLVLDAEQPELVSRMLDVYHEKLSYQVVNSAEQAKIGLTDIDALNIDLSYLQNGLQQGVDRKLFSIASEHSLAAIAELMQEAVNQAGIEPDVIFVTGGTAKSPVINQFISAKFKDKPVVIGDHFGSVTAGLSRWAETIFK